MLCILLTTWTAYFRSCYVVSKVSHFFLSSTKQYLSLLPTEHPHVLSDWFLSLLSIIAQVKALQLLCEHLAQSFLIYLDILK